MKNFQYLLAAWITLWGGFFFYQVSLARRLTRLRDQIENLKQQLRDR